jgi:hypothetical protein
MLLGNPNGVRSPRFEYFHSVSLAQSDRTPGPDPNNHPAKQNGIDNLMYNLGLTEIQEAAVQQVIPAHFDKTKFIKS